MLGPYINVVNTHTYIHTYIHTLVEDLPLENGVHSHEAYRHPGATAINANENLKLLYSNYTCCRVFEE